MLEMLIPYLTTEVVTGLFLFALFVAYRMFIRFIPNNRVGIREFLWSSHNLRSGIIALDGEAGYQPDVLRGGVHFLVPFRDRVQVMPLVTIPQGQIGYVFARDGRSLAPDQTLAATVESSDFQDVRAFLANGGQRGPQRRVL
ncbi:MAG: flotillin family protein, partial [bacterium]|nr:flotillin family protein [bacterium]